MHIAKFETLSGDRICLHPHAWLIDFQAKGQMCSNPCQDCWCYIKYIIYQHYCVMRIFFMYVCFCASAGEQRAPRTAGYKPRGFHDSKERRHIRKHIAVTLVDQYWHQFTQELRVLIVMTVWSVFSPLQIHCHTTCSPFSQIIYSCSGAQNSVPFCWFRHTTWCAYICCSANFPWCSCDAHPVQVLKCEQVKEWLELK